MSGMFFYLGFELFGVPGCPKHLNTIQTKATRKLFTYPLLCFRFNNYTKALTLCNAAYFTLKCGITTWTILVLVFAHGCFFYGVIF